MSACLFTQINIFVLIVVMRQMMRTRHAQNKSRDEKLRMGVKATAVMLPLLGITWVFGLLAFNSETLAFKYIFATLNSLEGSDDIYFPLCPQPTGDYGLFKLMNLFLVKAADYQYCSLISSSSISLDTPHDNVILNV